MGGSPPRDNGDVCARHLVYAPLPSYEAETLPGIREAVAEGGIDSAKLQIERLSGKLAAAEASARKAESRVRPSPKKR